MLAKDTFTPFETRDGMALLSKSRLVTAGEVNQGGNNCGIPSAGSLCLVPAGRPRAQCSHSSASSVFANSEHTRVPRSGLEMQKRWGRQQLVSRLLAYQVLTHLMRVISQTRPVRINGKTAELRSKTLLNKAVVSRRTWAVDSFNFAAVLCAVTRDGQAEGWESQACYKLCHGQMAKILLKFPNLLATPPYRVLMEKLEVVELEATE